jgi:hypothetical protein
MRDAAYGDRLDKAFDIMCIACIDLRCLWGKLNSLEFAFAVARQMAMRHQITATFAFMDGDRFGKRQRQMEFFGKQPDEQDVDDQDAAADEGGDGSGSDEPPEQEPLTAPEPLRASRYRKGEMARRMMAVEDQMQVTTDDTFASLLHVVHATVRDLAEVWAAYDRFCRDRLGVSAETMLAAWEFRPAVRSAVLERYAHVQPRPAQVDEYHGIYCRAWDRKFGDD